MDDERIFPVACGSSFPSGPSRAGVKPRPLTTTSATTKNNNSLPLAYEGETCRPCSHHGIENKHDDDLGTTVIEVTTVTKTTRKKYRVTEDENMFIALRYE